MGAGLGWVECPEETIRIYTGEAVSMKPLCLCSQESCKCFADGVYEEGIVHLANTSPVNER